MPIQFQWRHLAVYSQLSTDKADQCSFLSPPLKMCLSSGKKLEKKKTLLITESVELRLSMLSYIYARFQFQFV